jgi:hypothetical protein
LSVFWASKIKKESLNQKISLTPLSRFCYKTKVRLGGFSSNRVNPGARPDTVMWSSRGIKLEKPQIAMDNMA